MKIAHSGTWAAVPVPSAGSLLASASGAKPEAMIENIADFETGHATCDVGLRFKKLAEFKADVIIVAIGENVPDLAASPEAQEKFRKALAAMLGVVRPGGQSALFVRSSFWPDKVKDGIMRQVCTEAGGTFVDISRLGGVESLYARSERKIEHAGVGIHPGDKGMKAIADLIWKAISAAASGAPRAQLGAYFFDGWAGRSPLAGKADWAKNAPTHLTERMLKEFPDQTTAERIVLVYAWNEFGEGGHIAPTKEDPEGLCLKAIRSVVKP